MEANKSSDARMEAIKNLHKILSEKDEAIQQQMEKARRFKEAFESAEARISQMMLIHNSTGPTLLTPNKSSISSTIKYSADSLDSLKAKDSFVLSSSDLAKGLDAVKSSPEQDLQTDGDSPGSEIRKHNTSSAVSTLMFENVVKDNIRLKKMLQDVLRKDGTTIKELLEHQEYVDVIKQLRSDVASKHQKIDELEQWIYNQKNGQHQNLLIQLVELQKKLSHLNKEGQVKTAMIDNCLKENERLQTELKQKQQLMETPRRDEHASSDSEKNKSLQERLLSLEGEVKEKEDNQDLLKEQLKNYEEDYKAMRGDYNKQRDKYEKENTQLQLQLRKLFKENEALNKTILKEKQKSQQLEGLVNKYGPQFLKMSGVSTQSCAAAFPQDTWTTHQIGVVQDGPSNKKGALTTDSGDTNTSQNSSSKSGLKEQFECPHCLKNDFKDLNHFEDHCKICGQ